MSSIELLSEANINKEEGFYDAFPHGNGHIGLMSYGNPLNERIVINDSTMWFKPSGKRIPDDFYNNYKNVQALLLDNKISEAHKEATKLFPLEKMGIYTVAGFLDLTLLNKPVDNYKRVLDLDNGVSRVSFMYDNVQIQRTTFVSYPDDLGVIDLKSSEVIKYKLNLYNKDNALEKISNDTLLLSIPYNDNDLCEIGLKVVGSKILEENNEYYIEGYNMTIFIYTKTSYLNRLSPLDKLNGISMDFIYYLKRHQADYHSLFNKSSIYTSDIMMNRIYDLSKYLMISSSRDITPSNLQGIWNNLEYPRWDSKYTININLEMNYWSSLSNGLISCTKPLIDLIQNVNKNGKEIAKALYHSSGACCHHNTDFYADCFMTDKYMPATIWSLGNVWLSTFIYDYYIYTGDLEFLKKHKYIMDDAFTFVKDIAVYDKDGYLVISPSLSPENTYLLNGEKYNLANGVTMDDELIRDLGLKIIKANKALNICDNSIEEFLLKLHPYKISKNNTICEWHEDFEELDLGHRHISQMYSLFPGEEIRFNNELAPFFYNTIKKRLDNGSGQTGWSKAWITCMLAALHKDKECYQSYIEWIKNSTSKSLLDLHPPFQIDGNFGIAKAIELMLFRDFDDSLELIPALYFKINKFAVTNYLIKNNIILDVEYGNNILEVNLNSKIKIENYIIYVKDTKFNVSLDIGDNYFSFNTKGEIKMNED